MDKKARAKRKTKAPARRRNGQRMTAAKRRQAMARFLEAFTETGIVVLACREANIARSTVYYWREHDIHDFAKRYDDAEVEANEIIEAEIYRRGVTGWDEPVYYKGEMVGTIRKYSDKMLIFMAKARMPDKYRDRHGLVRAGGGPVEYRVRWVNGVDPYAPEET